MLRNEIQPPEIRAELLAVGQLLMVDRWAVRITQRELVDGVVYLEARAQGSERLVKLAYGLADPVRVLGSADGSGADKASG